MVVDTVPQVARRLGSCGSCSQAVSRVSGAWRAHDKDARGVVAGAVEASLGALGAGGLFEVALGL